MSTEIQIAQDAERALAQGFKRVASAAGGRGEMYAKQLCTDALVAIRTSSGKIGERLRQCTPTSVYQAVVTCASLGLSLSSARGEAYLVPYYDKDAGMQAQLMPGYRGWLLSAERAGYSIVSEAVYSGEVERGLFAMSRTPPSVRHDVDLSGAPRGELIGAYAAAYRDGVCVKSTWVTAEEIDRTRQDTGAWNSWASRMERKLAIKRLCQELPDERLNEMAALDDRASVVSVEAAPSEPERVDAPKTKRLAQRIESKRKKTQHEAVDVPPVRPGDAEFPSSAYDDIGPPPMSDEELAEFDTWRNNQSEEQV